MLRSPQWPFLLLVLFCVAGCGRPADGPLRIQATNREELEHWKFRARDRGTPELWRDFDAMLQELRLGIVRETNVTDAAVIDRTLIERVQGRTPEDVVALGLETKLKRFLEMREQQREFIDRNALLATRPDDESSKQHLEYYRDQQRERLATFEHEIQAIQQALQTYRPGSEAVATLVEPASTAPLTLAREEALAGIEEMIRRRRQMAVMLTGAWPLRIDEDGVTLPPELRAQFQDRRA